MKKKIVFIIFLTTIFMKESENIDVNIEKSIEILGIEEKPRIIFILPEYNPEFMVFKADNRYLLRFEKILEKDLFNR